MATLAPAMSVRLRAPSPWADVLTVTGVHTDGPLVVATITSKNPGIAVDVVLRQDNLLQL